MSNLENAPGLQPNGALPGSRAFNRGHRAAFSVPRARPRQNKWYSRFVHMMKVLLPAVALLLIGLVLVWPYLRSEDLQFRLNFAALTADETEDPSMVNLRPWRS